MNVFPGGLSKHVEDKIKMDIPTSPSALSLRLHSSPPAKLPGGFHPPPEIIAQWPAPNYENPEQRGKAVLAISIIFPLVCVIVVSLRLYTRMWIKKAPGLDDVLITLAVVCWDLAI